MWLPSSLNVASPAPRMRTPCAIWLQRFRSTPEPYEHLSRFRPDLYVGSESEQARKASRVDDGFWRVRKMEGGYPLHSPYPNRLWFSDACLAICDKERTYRDRAVSNWRQTSSPQSD